jgi:hypothetical protein
MKFPSKKLFRQCSEIDYLTRILITIMLFKMYLILGLKIMMSENRILFTSSKNVAIIFIVLMITLFPIPSFADAAAEMARKLQNPLANIKALMTDHVVGFDTGTDKGTSYGLQLQPVFALDMPDKGFTLIPRAVIPIVWIEPGTRTPITGQEGYPTPSGSGRVTGLGDSIVQLFFAPHTDSSWKWGVGPQVSIPTHTHDDLKGPDWGAGIAGVLVGNVTEQISFAGIAANHWGAGGKFNSAIIQPMVFYNWKSVPGAYLTYNAVISADWEADADDRWTVPLGLSIGRTFDMGGGNGLDAMIGPYKNVVRPDGAAEWTIRAQLNWLFP